MTYCGFDFGTSNSAIGVVQDGTPRLVEFDGHPIVRSAIFVDTEEHQLRYGATAVDDYLLGVPGRLIMSLKSVLGSSLMDEKTPIDGRWIPYTDVLGLLFGHVKAQAEATLGEELDSVVLGRPVRFSDDDDERDQRAENTLADIATRVGFRQVEFQYEPVAAARAWEASATREELCCVVDLGGGTADFSIIRIVPNRPARDRSDDVLANHGVHIGGTDLDYRLSLAAVMPMLGHGSSMRGSSGDVTMPTHYYHELSRWHRIFDMYRPEIRQAITECLAVSHDRDALHRLLHVLRDHLGHHLLEHVERTKRSLSERDEVRLALDAVTADLAVDVTRDRFVDAIAGELDQLADTLDETLARAGVRPGDIDCAMFTGGTALVPAVRTALRRVLEPARVVDADPFSAVATGLTLDARERFA